MAHFVIQTDGEFGTLLVDGEQPELFGRLVDARIRRMPSLDPDIVTDDLNPFRVRSREQAIVEVTLRLPIGPGNTLTIVRGNMIDDVQGPTADYVPGTAAHSDQSQVRRTV